MPATRRLRPLLLWLLLLPACSRPDASAPPQVALREAELCGVTFGYPATGWELSQPGADTSCAVELAPSGVVEKRELGTLRLRVVTDDFAAAAYGAGFEKGSDGWIVRGRHMMESDAEMVPVRQGQAVRGTPEIGYFPGDTGSYAGLMSNPRGVVGDGKRALVMEGGPASEYLVSTILRNVTFPRR